MPTNRLLEFIKDNEGFRSRVYDDDAGNQTIGYGHMLTEGENMAHITTQHAEELLREDLKDAIDAVDRYVLVPLNNNQRDALISFVFNIGATKFKGSTLVKRLNDYNYEAAADELLRWDKKIVEGEVVAVKGRTLRRKRERELFLL
jgi:lysozyme